MLDEKILKILRSNQDSYVSGEEICKTAGVSRTAIWKHMERLRTDGYEIDASPHLGYRLVTVPDSLIPSEIKWNLKTKILGKEVISYNKLGSTNDLAYELAEKNAKEGTVVFAEEQTKGKGRHGRNWVSPPKSGIYFSVILKPAIPPSEIPRITLLSAVSVAKAIRAASGLEAMIKWPNDVLVHGKKLCGILTEMKAEQDKIDFVIVGIGINVNAAIKNLPKGATSIKEELHAAISRVELARKILEILDENYLKFKKEGFDPIIDEWKALTEMLGARIKISLPNRTFEGLAHDIDADGSLLVRLDSGIVEKVSSGDVVMVR